MVESALYTQSRMTTTTELPTDLASAQRHEPIASAASTPIAVGSYDLVRKFLQHVVVENVARASACDESVQHEIDWAAVEASTRDCQTLEQAIGRAVVVADQMSRGVSDGMQSADFWPCYDANDPFFAFSVADVAPDFGDESRYRKRVAKKVAGILGTRRNLVTTSQHA
jgi:hypothetical protein